MIFAAVVVGLAIAAHRSSYSLWIDIEGHHVAYGHLLGVPLLH